MNNMKNSRTLIGILCCLAMLCSCSQTKNQYDLSNFGLTPDKKDNASPLMAKALEQIAASHTGDDTITIVLPKGRYDFYPEGAAQKEYFISNHDQDNPKLVGLPFENMKNIISMHKVRN